MNQIQEAVSPAGTGEQYMVMPAHLEFPHNAFHAYLELSPLQPTHTLDGDSLVPLHHSLLAEDPPRAFHLLAGAWAQVELAHVRDFQGASAEAQELILLAKHQTALCTKLIERKYQNREEYFDRLYRTNLLNLYTDHFAQLGPMHWPAQPTTFQRTAYTEVQRMLVDPLLDDFYMYCDSSDKLSRKSFGIIKGLLGELVVLQSLNRLQSVQEYADWAVAPASMRENCRDTQDRDIDTLSSAFDLKRTFADQTFTPLEVKWRDTEQSYSPSVAVVAANSRNRSGLAAAKAMSREVSGQDLTRSDEFHILALTDAVLESMSGVVPQGVSLTAP